MKNSRLLYKYFIGSSFFLILLALFIILWGAWVRITGSGDGCGVHWPLCHGYLIPTSEYAKIAQTWIEYFHRAKSGFFGFLVLVNFLICIVFFKDNSLLLKSVSGLLFFTITEGLLGAVLVLGSFVGQDKSLGRVLMISLHLGNTLLLLFFLVSTYYLSRYEVRKLELSFATTSFRNLIFTMLTVLIVAITGSWASLSSTLFPSYSLIQGILDDFNLQSHIILRLRVIHPIISLLAILVCLRLMFSQYRLISLLLILQVIIGPATILFLSPTWLKLTHLLMVDILWISLSWQFLKISTSKI